jgi:multimeric flavodoxin WrbA
MKTLLIVYQSMTGGTRQMAQAAAAGAAEFVAAEEGTPATGVRLLRAPDAVPADVLAADAYVFATPENLGTMAGLMKDFFDRCYYPVLDRINGRPYAALVCAGSDGSGAARQIERIAAGWRLKAVAPALIVCTQAQTPDQIGRDKHIAPEDLARCREAGARLAAGLALGID